MEYRDITTLSYWDKNQQVREITEENWNKLVADIRRNGILEPLKIDATGVTYDGNNRLKATNQIIAEGQTTAENGKDLTKMPIIVYAALTEKDKWELALKGNEQFANWNQEGLSNYLPEFEELDLSLINIDFFEPESIDEQLDEEAPPADLNPSQKEPKTIICPNCSHSFTP